LNQKDNIKLIKKTIAKYLPEKWRIRYIKIGAGRFQEAGLPDLIILIKKDNQLQLQFWIEIKRNWLDKPTELQKFNIKDFQDFGFITFFVAGNEICFEWPKEDIKFPIINLDDYFRIFFGQF